MAAEAVRQASGIQDGVSFREVVVHTALVVHEDVPLELVTTMRRHRLTDSLNSEWWEFSISSHNGHVWTKHCSGEVRGQSYDTTLEYDEQSTILPRKIDSQKWYESVRRQGLHYGPSFTTLQDLRTSTGFPHRGQAKAKNNRWEDHEQYHLHPAIVDTLLQLMNCSLFDGTGHAYRRMVGAKIDSMTIFRCSEEVLQFAATSDFTDEGCVAEGSIYAGKTTVLRSSGIYSTIFEEHDTDEGADNMPMTARCHWVPHVDFKSIDDLFKPHQPKSHGVLLSSLTQLTQYAIDLVHDQNRHIEVQSPHLVTYEEWLATRSSPHAGDFDSSVARERFQSLAKELENTSLADGARAMMAVMADMEALLRQEKTGLEILTIDGILDRFTALVREPHDYDYIRSLGFAKPNMKILEVGVGLGHRTQRILQNLVHPGGRPMYSVYVVANESSGLLNTAKEQLKDFPNLEFANLDLS